MKNKVSELEITNSALNRRIKELSDQIDDLGRVNRADIARKDHDIDYLNEQLNSLTKEYQELLEIKIAELTDQIGDLGRVNRADKARIEQWLRFPWRIFNQ